MQFKPHSLWPAGGAGCRQDSRPGPQAPALRALDLQESSSSHAAVSALAEIQDRGVLLSQVDTCLSPAENPERGFFLRDASQARAGAERGIRGQ